MRREILFLFLSFMQTLIEASKAKYVLLCLLVYLVTLIGVRKDELRLED